MVKKRLIAVTVIMVVSIALSMPAMANELLDKQKQYNIINDKISKQKEKYAELEDEVNNNNKKLKVLDSYISGVNLEISNYRSKISGVQKNINVSEKELDTAIAEYNKQDEIMKKRINIMYKNGTSMGYLQVVLDSTSFSDFITRADILKRIVDYDANLLKQMKEKRDEIDKKKAVLEKDKSELVTLKTNLDYRKKQLEKQEQERKTLIAALNKQMAIINANIQSEKADAIRIQAEIKSLISKTGVYSGSKNPVMRYSDFPAGKKPRITSPFGSRVDPITGKLGAFHYGIDIGTARITNIPIYAMAPGKVILARWYGGYGNTVVIDHGGGIVTQYAHNNKLLVEKGQTVAGGQKIALSGSTGRSTGPHLDFSVQKNGNYIDPMPYFFIGD